MFGLVVLLLGVGIPAWAITNEGSESASPEEVSASLQGIDPELEHAARVLGASGPVAFFTVTLPLIRPGVAAGALFSFIVSFDNVPVSVFLLGAGQMTLPVKIFSAIEYGVDPSIAAISTMLIVLTGAGLAVAERWIGFHRFV